MIDSRHDDDARRAYWTEQMDAAYEFMQTVMAFPVEESGEALAALPEAAKASGVEVAFSDTDGGRLFYLREGLIDQFLAVARSMNEQGLVLKVLDGYRTVEIQRGLGRAPRVFDMILKKVKWELGGAPPTPETMFRRITALIATSPKIGTHMSGSAMDIAVLDRDSGEEIDRGCPYIDLSERTPMDSPFVPEPAREARRRITAIMAEHGFVAYPYEFWHYSSGDAYDRILNGCAEPARYGPVEADLATGRVAPSRIQRPRFTTRPASSAPSSNLSSAFGRSGSRSSLVKAGRLPCSPKHECDDSAGPRDSAAWPARPL